MIARTKVGLKNGQLRSLGNEFCPEFIPEMTNTPNFSMNLRCKSLERLVETLHSSIRGIPHGEQANRKQNPDISHQPANQTWPKPARTTSQYPHMGRTKDGFKSTFIYG